MLKEKYFIVKIAGKGNIKDDNLKKLIDNISSTTDIINKMIKDNKSGKNVLIIWDGDNYQDNSPFTMIIKKLHDDNKYDLAALKPEWKPKHIETWNAQNISNIKTYIIDKTEAFNLSNDSNPEDAVGIEKIESYMVNNKLCDMYVSYGALLYENTSGFQQLYGDNMSQNKQQIFKDYKGEMVSFYPFKTNYLNSTIYTNKDLGFEIFLKDDQKKTMTPFRSAKSKRKKPTKKKRVTKSKPTKKRR